MEFYQKKVNKCYTYQQTLVYITKLYLVVKFCYNGLMENNYIDMIKSTPKLKSKKCKLIALVISLSLQYSAYISTIIFWIWYDYFIAFFALIFSFLIVGIVRAKIRNIAIPPNQQEYPYTDKGIAEWYTAQEICNDALESELELL